MAKHSGGNWLTPGILASGNPNPIRYMTIDGRYCSEQIDVCNRKHSYSGTRTTGRHSGDREQKSKS